MVRWHKSRILTKSNSKKFNSWLHQPSPKYEDRPHIIGYRGGNKTVDTLDAGTRAVLTFFIALIGHAFIGILVLGALVFFFPPSTIMGWIILVAFVIVVIAVPLLSLFVAIAQYSYRKEILLTGKSLYRNPSLFNYYTDGGRIFFSALSRIKTGMPKKTVRENKLQEIEEAILDFQPLKEYILESECEAALTGFLQTKFERVEVQKRIGSGIIDVMIDGKYGIEIKNAAYQDEINRLIGQILGYRKNVEHLFVVLFNTEPQYKHELEERLKEFEIEYTIIMK